MAGHTKLLLISVLLVVNCFVLGSSRRHGCHGPTTVFSFSDFNDDNAMSKFTLIGDAQRLESGTLQLSGSGPRTSGSFFISQPVKFATPKGQSLSFSTFFSFSMDSNKGDGLAFVIAPAGEAFHGSSGPWLGLAAKEIPNAIAIEFDTSTDVEAQDPSGNHVGIDIESLVSVATAEISDGFESDRLYAWIDYMAFGKTLEVRLSTSAENKPENPTVSYEVDLANLWQDEMFVGFSSSTGENAQKHMIYSWKFITIRPIGLWRGGHGPRRFFGPGSFFGSRHGPQDWHKGPHDWHHGPRSVPLQTFPIQDMNDDHHEDFHPDHHHGDFHPDHHHDHHGDWHPDHDHHGDWHPDHDHHGDWHPDHDHHGDWHPDHDHHGDWHPDHHDHHHDHHGHDGDDSIWFGDLNEVWEVILSLLIGAACGTAVAGAAILVWVLIRRCCKKDEDFSSVEEEKTGLIHGYQKLLSQAAAAAPNGYQKLPSVEKPEGKSEESC